MIYRISNRKTATNHQDKVAEIQQQERLNKITPEGNERSHKFSYKNKSVGSFTVNNPLKRIPTRYDKFNGPKSAEFTVSGWTNSNLTVNVTVAGNVEFFIYG